MTGSAQAADDLAGIFPGDGEMARRGREFDWGSTSLGPIEDWSTELRAAVQLTMETPFPVNLWTGPDLILIYNDGYRHVLGAKHPRALGRTGREVWAEIWPEIEPLFDRIYAGGPPSYAEDARFVMERNDGPPGEAWFTYSLSPIRGSDGAVIAVLNIATETTQRVVAERASLSARADAERAERRLRDVFAQAPAFMAVLRGPEHVFEFVNDAYRRLIGNREVIGRRVYDALPEVRDQGFIQILDRVFRTNEPFVGRELEIMLARSRGGPLETRYVDFIYQPIADDEGRTSGLVAHGSDVTEAVLARRQIEESEARYRFLTNAIPVQVWTATPDGALDYVSDRAAAYFGRTAGDVVGDQWLSVLHPDDVERTLNRWRESLRTGDPYEVEFRLFNPATREYRWHLTRADAQRDASGAVIRWVGTNTDIEDRKRAEADLQRLTAEAMEANTAKSAFLASMSHELRTPLNAIGGYAQLLEMGVRGPVNEEQRIDLLKIQRSKNHLDSLVSDVLNFAKLSAGRVEYRVANVILASILSEVVDMVTPQLTARRQTLVVRPMGELTVRADEDKTRQILLNLIGNAMKFTPADGSITVSAREQGGNVLLDVSDTGIGIPEEELERIFEPFVQAKPKHKVSEQGVGLGLAISRQLARGMGGDLRATSTEDQGSTFTLTLPRGVDS
jgi:PAS domain S-box-containing protein